MKRRGLRINCPTSSNISSRWRKDYDVLLCDVWGVIHNGVAAFAPACDALLRFRERGGTAILITNAPRPGDSVARILDRLAVPRRGL